MLSFHATFTCNWHHWQRWKLHTNISPLLFILTVKLDCMLILINYLMIAFPDSKVHGAHMGPTWVLSAPDGPQVGPMNLAIRVVLFLLLIFSNHLHNLIILQKVSVYYNITSLLPHLLSWEHPYILHSAALWQPNPLISLVKPRIWGRQESWVLILLAPVISLYDLRRHSPSASL